MGFLYMNKKGQANPPMDMSNPPGQEFGQSNDPYGDPNQGYYQDNSYGTYDSMPPMDSGMGMPPPMQDSTMDRQRIEEMAEAIIDEKWEEMLRNISKIAEWRDQTESTLTRMQQEMADLKENFDRLHKAIIGKISEYDKNILNVGTEIKAMEKVFQKILPTFTENVGELTRITRNLGTRAAQSQPRKTQPSTRNKLVDESQS